jgi:hypothetical protein
MTTRFDSSTEYEEGFTMSEIMAARSPKLPKMPRQASGKTKPKAPGKANPVTPAQRPYPWGGSAVKKGK